MVSFFNSTSILFLFPLHSIVLRIHFLIVFWLILSISRCRFYFIFCLIQYYWLLFSCCSSFLRFPLLIAFGCLHYHLNIFRIWSNSSSSNIYIRGHLFLLCTHNISIFFVIQYIIASAHAHDSASTAAIWTSSNRSKIPFSHAEKFFRWKFLVSTIHTPLLIFKCERKYSHTPAAKN